MVIRIGACILGSIHLLVVAYLYTCMVMRLYTVAFSIGIAFSLYHVFTLTVSPHSWSVPITWRQNAGFFYRR